MKTNYLFITQILILIFSSTILSAATVNPAVKPVDRLDEVWWADRHKTILRTVRYDNIDLVFVGDSITERWETTGKDVWKKYYYSRDALNIGFSGDRTQHVLWRLDHGEITGIEPRAVIIMIGSNNANSSDSAQAVAVGTIAVCERVKARLPNAEILLLGIFPRGTPSSTLRNKITQANKIISLRADGINIHYMDIGQKFLNSDGTISKELMGDYVHPTAKGYEIWAQSIESMVARLMQ